MIFFNADCIRPQISVVGADKVFAVVHNLHCILIDSVLKHNFIRLSIINKNFCISFSDINKWCRINAFAIKKSFRYYLISKIQSTV